jgi:hypothetical protein
MSPTLRSIEHAGASIEAAEVNGEWFVTIDGTEVKQSFRSAALALDYARRRVTLRNRRSTRQRSARAVAHEDTPEETERRARERFEAFRKRVADLLDIGTYEEWSAR